MSLRLIAKWSCDGALGQSKYKQSFADKALSDESIFMISMVLLCLESNILSEYFIRKEVWKNPRPSLTGYVDLLNLSMSLNLSKK